MRVLIDVVHPAHVHFYRHLIAELQDLGHETLVASRHKDVTIELLDCLEIPHTPVSRAGGNSLLALTQELVRRVFSLRRLGRAFRADVVLTRNPAGVQAARLLRIPGVFDTDDGAAAGVHWKAAVPFATHITMPDCLHDDRAGKRVAYPSYKAMAYLHPNRFSPDPEIRQRLGLGGVEPYFVVRFVSMTASHDRSERGMSADIGLRAVSLLAEHGRVFLSSEGEPPKLPGVEPLRIEPHFIHDVLANAALLVGDSQTMAAEAAMLGVPSVRMSSWAGRLAYLTEIEETYGLTFGFTPAQVDAFLDKVGELADGWDDPVWGRRHQALLAAKSDLTTWYRDFVVDRFDQ